MLGYSRQQITPQDVEAVMKVLTGSWLTQGPMVPAFEDAICKITGAKYAVAVSSATAGLHISLLANGIGSSNSIIVPTNTFVSTANAGLMAGAEVAFCDTDSNTGNLDLNYLRSVYTTDVDVIMPVHFAGLPVDVKYLASIIDTDSTILIEDASHALGAKYSDGTMVGSCKYSKCTVFSFHPVKIVTTGEGGVVTTNDEEVYKNLLRLRSHGINKLDDTFENLDLAYEDGSPNLWYYEMTQLGFNYRLTDIQSALGLSQLTRLDDNFKRRQEIANYYDIFFEKEKFVKPLQLFNRERNAHHLYPLVIDFDKIELSRGDLMLRLKEKGIGTQVHYIPVHLQPFYQNRVDPLDRRRLPGAEKFYKHTLSIPCYPDLTQQQTSFVMKTVSNLVNFSTKT